KAAILWHELVHVKQRLTFGHARFLLRYATARGRLCIEAPAYRMSMRVYRSLLGDGFDASAYMKKTAASLRESYRLATVDADDFHEALQAAWEPELLG